MALLTADDVLNKKFQPTKFREGYDQDEVDDFLDEVVNTLRAVYAENEELKARLEAAPAGEASEAPAAPVAEAPEAASTQEFTEVVPEPPAEPVEEPEPQTTAPEPPVQFGNEGSSEPESAT